MHSPCTHYYCTTKVEYMSMQYCTLYTHTLYYPAGGVHEHAVLHTIHSCTVLSCRWST
jgi:hypothetical protein